MSSNSENLTYKIIRNECNSGNYKPLKYLNIQDNEFIIEILDEYRDIHSDYINFDIATDIDMATILTLYNHTWYKLLPKETRLNEEFSIQYLINWSGLISLSSVESELLEKKSFVIELIKKSPAFIPEVPQDMINNIETFNYVYDYTISRGFGCLLLLEFPDELINIEEIAIKLVKSNSYAIEKLNQCNKNNIKLAKIVASKYSMAIEYLSDEMRDNEEVIKIAVNKCGWTLQFASDRLKDNYDIVLDAVMNEPLNRIELYKHIVIYTNMYIYGMDDYDDIDTSTPFNYISFKYASDRLKQDASIIKAALLRYPMAINELSKDIVTNENLYIDKRDNFYYLNFVYDNDIYTVSKVCAELKNILYNIRYKLLNINYSIEYNRIIEFIKLKIKNSTDIPLYRVSMKIVNNDNLYQLIYYDDYIDDGYVLCQGCVSIVETLYIFMNKICDDINCHMEVDYYSDSFSDDD